MHQFRGIITLGCASITADAIGSHDSRYADQEREWKRSHALTPTHDD